MSSEINPHTMDIRFSKKVQRQYSVESTVSLKNGTEKTGHTGAKK